MSDTGGNINKYEETIGLLYGGAVILGTSSCALAGYVLSGGRTRFFDGGWVDVVIGAIVGGLLGVGTGLVCHAILTIKKKKQS